MLHNYFNTCFSYILTKWLTLSQLSALHGSVQQARHTHVGKCKEGVSNASVATPITKWLLRQREIIVISPSFITSNVSENSC